MHIESPAFQYPTTVLLAAPLVPSPRLLSMASTSLALALAPLLVAEADIDAEPVELARVLALALVLRVPLELAAMVVLLLAVLEELTVPPLPGVPSPICFPSKSNTA